MAKKLVGQLSPEELSTIRLHLNALGTLKLASACSGTNMTLVWASLLARELGARTKVKDVFTCEKEADKRDFIAFVGESFGQLKDKKCCSFVDMVELSGERAQCSTCHRRCPVPCGEDGPMIACVGFVCKNLSKQFNVPGGDSKNGAHVCLAPRRLDESH